ncbi:MAG: hypothetical protein QM765_10420 [Myxococcales bacterium]
MRARATRPARAARAPARRRRPSAPTTAWISPPIWTTAAAAPRAARARAAIAGSSVCGCFAPLPDFCAGPNACVDLATDLNYCGSCTTPCTRQNGTCVGGSCTCPAQKKDYCAGFNLCTDLQTDRQHCGTCTVSCAGLEVCREGLCCAPDGQVCDGKCCAGTACCPNGCQTAHSNGLGGTFYDCLPLGTHTTDSARAAADAWKPAAKADLTGVPCTNTLCLDRAATDQCGRWCDNGKVTASAVGSTVCLCPEMNPAVQGTWN